ncbi:MAG: Gfo/Idh/MocA family oxidoreductase [Chloroflexota bacterium]
MKFLIAGLGSIGRRHLRNLLALGESDVLLYRTHLGTLPDDELAGLPVETHLETALAHHPQAAIIANPTALHLDVAIPAARAGCHLLLEKPVANNLERVEELRQAVAQGSGKTLVGFQFRFHPGLVKINQLLQEAAIGRPLSARAHWGEYLPGWHPWEDYRQGYSARADLGGGVVLTLCHPLDYLRWLLGEVSALWAFTAQISDLELGAEQGRTRSVVPVEDTAEIGLRFESGALGSVHLDYSQRPPAHRLEIVGTQGTIRWDNTDGTVHLYRAGVDHWERFAVPDGFERNHLFLAQMRHFIDIVNDRAEPLCTLEDGLQALKLALAAHESQQQHRMIVM